MSTVDATPTHAGANASAGASGVEAVNSAIGPSIEKIRTSLAREGADIHVEIDGERSTIVASLERKRIVCEGCLLPEHLVRTMITNALRGNAAASGFKVETRNWNQS